ncbi:MAG: Ig-like domain-containing protein [Lachnospiraceae bacterium]|nr:Ig-like domain-containing protein [Lachnospiraceae bacterium]
MLTIVFTFNSRSVDVSAKKKIMLSDKKLYFEEKNDFDRIYLDGITKKQHKKIKWKTTNKSVATVKKLKTVGGCKVTAKKTGKCTIYTKLNGKKYKCKVIVEIEDANSYTNNNVYRSTNNSNNSSGSNTSTSTPVPTRGKINRDSIVIREGEEFQLSLEGATASSWTSSDGNIAYVFYSGKVKGYKDGNATITCTDKNGFTYTCNVTVTTGRIIMASLCKQYGKAMTLGDKEGYSLSKLYYTDDGGSEYVTVFYCEDDSTLMFSCMSDEKYLTTIEMPVYGFFSECDATCYDDNRKYAIEIFAYPCYMYEGTSTSGLFWYSSNIPSSIESSLKSSYLGLTKAVIDLSITTARAIALEYGWVIYSSDFGFDY